MLRKHWNSVNKGWGKVTRTTKHFFSGYIWKFYANNNNDIKHEWTMENRNRNPHLWCFLLRFSFVTFCVCFAIFFFFLCFFLCLFLSFLCACFILSFLCFYLSFSLFLPWLFVNLLLSLLLSSLFLFFKSLHVHCWSVYK